MTSRKRESDQEGPYKRFWKSRSYKEEEEMLENAVPLSTRYKNKWSVNLFEDWIRDRDNKRAAAEEISLGISLDDIEDLDIERWEKMTPLSLNFWIGKFVEEVANKKECDILLGHYVKWLLVLKDTLRARTKVMLRCLTDLTCGEFSKLD